MKPKLLQNISRCRFLLSSAIGFASAQGAIATSGMIATNFLQNKSFAIAPRAIASDKMRQKIPMVQLTAMFMLIARLFGVVAINRLE